jgi:hypothetical protein
MPAELDPADVRPLTSREISKILCSIIGGVVAADARVKKRVPEVLRLVRMQDGAHVLAIDDEARRACTPACDVSWEIALLATVSGLRTWCSPVDLEVAIEWTDANMAALYPQTESPSSN